MLTLSWAVPRGNAESAPERDSESGLRARTEFESEVRKSNWVRAQNWARYGIADGSGVERGHRPQGSSGFGGKVRDFEVSSKARSEFGFEC